MRDLPVGTVTFLFTDIEGSTRLLYELGPERYADELGEHRRVLRDAVQRHHGFEVDTQGDAFFVAFPRASDAAAAAQDVQIALAGGSVRVRMGLHTGEPTLAEEGYVGMDVHRAARIASLAHGGQIVISLATRSVLPRLPVTDLGEHRLKDIDSPERLYQLGPGRFPPLRSPFAVRLPTPVSSFVGRLRELADAASLFFGRRPRLITITGPGGAGKTRFAIELARSLADEMPGGATFVGLAPLRDPSLMLPSISQQLGVQDRGDLGLLDAIAGTIGDRQTLLVLDNLEHLLPAAASHVSLLLRSCPALTLLVTSRESLRVSGEVDFDLPPLAQEEATDLFVERARAVGGQVESTAEVRNLVARLDGLPLALELAAARMRMMQPEQLMTRLAKRLDLKGGRDAEARQQTLRATIQWSYELLSPEEQELFSNLAVFAGGWTIETAEAVCRADLDALEALLDKSLIRRRGDSTEVRFWMLEMIREFAAERLAETGMSVDVQFRYRNFFSQAALHRSGDTRNGEPEAIAFIAAELPNMRQALADAFDVEEGETVVALLLGLWFFWLVHGYGHEGSAWAKRFVESGLQLDPLYRVAALLAVSELLRFTGDDETAIGLKEEAVSIGEANPGAQVLGRNIDRMVAAAVRDLGLIALERGDVQKARDQCQRALELRRALGDPAGIGHALEGLAEVAYGAGDYVKTRELCLEVLPLIGSSFDELQTHLMLSLSAFHLGDRDGAVASLREALTALEGHDRVALGSPSIAAAGLAAIDERMELAASLLGASAGVVERAGTPYNRFDLRDIGEIERRARLVLGDQSFQAEYERGVSLQDEEIAALIGDLLDSTD